MRGIRTGGGGVGGVRGRVLGALVRDDGECEGDDCESDERPGGDYEEFGWWSEKGEGNESGCRGGLRGEGEGRKGEEERTV